MKIESKEKVIDHINQKYKDYQGYVQFSHRPINKSKDIFLDANVKVENESGFIYEAHFCDGKESIQIRQINNSWLVSKTDISDIKDEDKEEYISNIEGLNYNVKMAQIWETKEDILCDGMEVKKLSKVVFSGFLKGDKK